MSRLTQRLTKLDLYFSAANRAAKIEQELPAQAAVSTPAVHPLGNHRQRRARASILRKQAKQLARKEMERQKKETAEKAAESTEP
jgi:hypothetical protein